MRIYHFTLIFAVFAMIMLAMTAFSLEETFDEDRRAANIDLLLDKASESAADVLKEANASGIYGVRDLAVDTFYASLSAGLGLSDSTPALTLLRLYVPVIVVADGDIMFVCYDEFGTADDGTEALARRWSGPIVREECDLEDCLEHYCNKHNETAQRAGIVYEFTIPDTEGGLYLRSGEGAGFFALFQGYPADRYNGEICNSYSFAGTGVDEAEQFFINLRGEGFASEKYFHRKDCRFLTEESVMFGSKKKCAEYGAFECPECGD